jgi:hypothetical protein
MQSNAFNQPLSSSAFISKANISSKQHYTQYMNPYEQCNYREMKMNFNETMKEFRENIEISQQKIQHYKKHYPDTIKDPSDYDAYSDDISFKTQTAKQVIDADMSTRGSMLFGICRGKASEGIDFSNEQGRCVVVLGLPLGSYVDPQTVLKTHILTKISTLQNQELLELKNRISSQPNPNNQANQQHTFETEKRRNILRLKYLEDNKQLDGDLWYNQNAMRAVNQAIGRVIRHRYDYGVIILAEKRIAEPKNSMLLSKWLQKEVFIPNTGAGYGDSAVNSNKQGFAQVFKRVADFMNKAPLVVEECKRRDERLDEEFRSLPSNRINGGSSSLVASNPKKSENNDQINNNPSNNKLNPLLLQRNTTSILSQQYLNQSDPKFDQNDQTNQNLNSNFPSAPIKRSHIGSVQAHQSNRLNTVPISIDDDDQPDFSQIRTPSVNSNSSMNNTSSGSLTSHTSSVPPRLAKSSLSYVSSSQQSSSAQYSQYLTKNSQSQNVSSASTSSSSSSTPPDTTHLCANFAKLFWAAIHLYIPIDDRKKVVNLCSSLMGKQNPEDERTKAQNDLASFVCKLPEVLSLVTPLAVPGPNLTPDVVISDSLRGIDSEGSGSGIINNPNPFLSKLDPNLYEGLLPELLIPFPDIKDSKQGSFYKIFKPCHPFFLFSKNGFLNPALFASTPLPHSNPEINNSIYENYTPAKASYAKEIMPLSSEERILLSNFYRNPVNVFFAQNSKIQSIHFFDQNITPGKKVENIDQYGHRKPPSLLQFETPFDFRIKQPYSNISLDGSATDNNFDPNKPQNQSTQKNLPINPHQPFSTIPIHSLEQLLLLHFPRYLFAAALLFSVPQHLYNPLRDAILNQQKLLLSQESNKDLVERTDLNILPDPSCIDILQQVRSIRPWFIKYAEDSFKISNVDTYKIVSKCLFKFQRSVLGNFFFEKYPNLDQHSPIAPQLSQTNLTDPLLHEIYSKHLQTAERTYQNLICIDGLLKKSDDKNDHKNKIINWFKIPPLSELIAVLKLNKTDKNHDTVPNLGIDSLYDLISEPLKLEQKSKQDKLLTFDKNNPKSEPIPQNGSPENDKIENNTPSTKSRPQDLRPMLEKDGVLFELLRVVIRSTTTMEFSKPSDIIALQSFEHFFNNKTQILANYFENYSRNYEQYCHKNLQNNPQFIKPISIPVFPSYPTHSDPNVGLIIDSIVAFIHISVERKFPLHEALIHRLNNHITSKGHQSIKTIWSSAVLPFVKMMCYGIH